MGCVSWNPYITYATATSGVTPRMGRVSWNVLHIAESIYLCGHALLGSIRYGVFGATSLAIEHRDDPWHYNRPSVHCGFESKLGCIPGRCISRGLPLWWETYIVSAQMSNFLKSHYFFSEIFCGDFLFSLAGVFSCALHKTWRDRKIQEEIRIYEKQVEFSKVYRSRVRLVHLRWHILGDKNFSILRSFYLF